MKEKPERVPLVMKRHESLIPLSRQHHDALILAQLIKKGAPEYKGLPTELIGKRKYTLEMFRDHLVPHFEAEELILLPFVLGADKEIDELSQKIIDQHKMIADYIEEIRVNNNVEENMDKLGNLLSEHVRLEERKFFQQIQKKFPEEKLLKLADQLKYLDNKKKNC